MGLKILLIKLNFHSYWLLWISVLNAPGARRRRRIYRSRAVYPSPWVVFVQLRQMFILLQRAQNRRGCLKQRQPPFIFPHCQQTFNLTSHLRRRCGVSWVHTAQPIAQRGQMFSQIGLKLSILVKTYPHLFKHFQSCTNLFIFEITDYRYPVRKSPSLHGRKSNPDPKFLGMVEAYFVCHIGPKFKISLIYAFIGCP